MQKINKILSILIIVIFLIEFISMGIYGLCIYFVVPSISSVEDRMGPLIYLFYFTIVYIWTTIPAILSLLLRNMLAKNKIALIIAILLNGIVFIKVILPRLVSLFY